MTDFDITDVTALTPETFGQCPVCRTVFEQPETGRRRTYCSDACKQKEFRNTKALRNSSPETRSALVTQQMAVGDWRCHRLPAWPHYRCLACGAAVGGERTEADRIAFGWYDWNDFDQVAGIYRRVVCVECAPAV
jgi:hypothetical protein